MESSPNRQGVLASRFPLFFFSHFPSHLLIFFFLFLLQVASIVGKSIVECQRKYFEELEERGRRRAPKETTRPTKGAALITFERTADNKVVITGAKGTLKRRRQLRELISQVQKGHLQIRSQPTNI